MKFLVARGSRTSRCIAVARASALALAAASGFPGAACGQEIPKPQYITYIPREQARAVARTDANVRFRVFGDPRSPGYRDTDPADGIDDTRNALFLRLAERFAPWMARNSYGFPMDARRIMSSRDTFPLILDHFDLAHTAPRLLASDSINVGRLQVDAPCPPDAPPANPQPDCRIRALLRERGPQAPVVLEPQGADSEPATIMYYNFPGDGPRSWADVYGAPGEVDDVGSQWVGWALAYMHPFVAAAAGPAGGYDLVLQYWFFYPTNDAGNKHEGDWEHLNVVIAPRAMVTRPSSAEDIQAMLEGRTALDELVIRRVEYYFHHWVMLLDYSAPNVYAPRAEWERQALALPESRRGERIMWTTIRRHAYADRAETRLNLHPYVFIGGNDRGLAQILHAPTGLGRSSHGSYPFPGLYKAIGPGGTGESIDHPWSTFDDPPAPDAPETEPVVRFDNPSRLEILPDWEDVAERALVEPAIRARWSWLLLPALLGYPATESPFAGVVRYAETGNLSILPPIYSGGWNRAGDGAGYGYYQPHRLAGVFPADLQDSFRPSWGVANLTLPLLSVLPPFDLLIRTVETPVRAATASERPQYFRSEDLPFRGFALGGGAAMFDPGDDFWRLIGFPELATPFLQHVIALGGSIGSAGVGPPHQEYLVGWSGELSFYLGKRFASTNALSHGYSGLTQEVFAAGSSQGNLTANLNFWEYTGSLRYNLLTNTFQPFVMAGYGLSWYRLEDVMAFGDTLGGGASRWVRKPGLFENLLPNTWHFGAGLEVIPFRAPSRVDLSLKASAARHSHDLGLSTGNATTLFFQDTHVSRWVFRLAASLNY